MNEISDEVETGQRRETPPKTPPSARRKLTGRKVPGPPLSVNFAHGLLENSDLKKPRRALDFVISLAAQAAFVILLILLPLVYTQAFDVRDFEKTMLILPPPPPPPPAASSVRVIKPKASLFDNGRLFAPRVVPQHVQILKEINQEPPGLAGVAGGVPGGVAGGTLGGVLGGVLSSGSLPAPPPPRPAKINGPIRVGGQVKAPRLIRNVQPVYPELAEEARVQGEVVLDCVIDEHGNVTQIKLISGHPLLVRAAFDAVRQWKYQPTTLNGIPVAVEMKVTVTFKMAG